MFLFNPLPSYQRYFMQIIYLLGDTLRKNWLDTLVKKGIPNLAQLKKIHATGFDMDGIVTAKDLSGFNDSDTILAFVLFYVSDVVGNNRYVSSEGEKEIDKDAVREEGMLAVKFLVEEVGVDVNKVHMMTPLMCASLNPFIGPAATACIIARGVDLDLVTEPHRNSALHLAVFSGNIHVTKQLVEAGSNIYLKNTAGKTPFDYADMKETSLSSVYDLAVWRQKDVLLGRTQIMDWMFKFVDDNEMEDGEDDVAPWRVNVRRRALELKSSSLAKRWLEAVVQNGLPNLALLKELHTTGYDMSAIVTTRGLTGFDDSDTFLAFVLFYVNDVVSSKSRYEDVDKAHVRAEAIEAVRFLVEEAGVDVDRSAMMTPLMCACTNPFIGEEAALYLIDHGVNVNQLSGQNRNAALHCAVFAGNLNLTKALIAADADLELANAHGKCPLDYAFGDANAHENVFKIVKGRQDIVAAGRLQILEFIDSYWHLDSADAAKQWQKNLHQYSMRTSGMN